MVTFARRPPVLAALLVAAAQVAAPAEGLRGAGRPSTGAGAWRGALPRRVRGAARQAEMDAALSVEIVESVGKVEEATWNACAGTENPFLAWEFFAALEDSGSACREEGWQPHHLVAREGDGDGEVIGLVPLYLKSHSMGEYVFDQAWANAYYQFNGLWSEGSSDYYPKLQGCVPFTPATGPRLLVHPRAGSGERRLAVMGALAEGLKQVTEKLGVSSCHVSFSTREEWEAMGGAGFLQRLGVQYHWVNNGYRTFDEFLDSLKARKRKSIKQERRKVEAAPVTIRRLRGADIEERHWEAFYRFYLNTVDAHWARDYLKRDFFKALGATQADRVLLVVAEEEDGTPVAGALNLIGEDALYGRNWGCDKQYDSLHFELCYYQAIEAAIEMGLGRVEAGAQGEHKIKRGYLPSLTYSAHYIRKDQKGFKAAVEDFLQQERRDIYYTLAVLSMQESPFKGDAVDEHLKTQGVKVQDNRIYLCDPEPPAEAPRAKGEPAAEAGDAAEAGEAGEAAEAAAAKAAKAADKE